MPFKISSLIIFNNLYHLNYFVKNINILDFMNKFIYLYISNQSLDFRLDKF